MNLQKSNSEIDTEHKISPQQRKFQRLCKKIEQEKARLDDWNTAQKDIQSRAHNEVLPAYEQLRQIIFLQIELLVKQKQQKLTKGQLLKIDQKIEKLSVQLLQSRQMTEKQVAFLTALLKEYGHSVEIRSPIEDYGDLNQDDLEQEVDDIEYNFDEEGADEEQLQFKIEILKSMLTDEYDLEPDFFDFSYDLNDPDDFMEKFSEKMDKKLEQDFLNQFTNDERKRYEKQIEREREKEAKVKKQREQAKKIANQSMKTVYLKIASIIHPDREQDEQKKQEKTELLQQVNQAYEKNDLLSLLSLQMELGQQQDVTVAENHLKAYNLILEEQLEKLNSDIEDIIYSFDWSGHISMFSNRKIKVQDLYKKYEKDWVGVQQKLAQAELTLENFKDLKTLKALMRSQYLWEMC